MAAVKLLHALTATPLVKLVMGLVLINVLRVAMGCSYLIANVYRVVVAEKWLSILFVNLVI